MCDEPLVSVLVITYNQEKYIEEALRSALEQDYDNLEVVVGDDTSTDRTPEIIMDLAAEYPERLVPILGKERLGITGNSNRVLRKCRGKYIAFMGGDDVFLPGKIKAQVAWFEEDERRVLCGHQVEVFYDDNSARPYLLNDFLPEGEGPSWIIENEVPFGAVAIMVRRKNVPPQGFDVRLPFVSDRKLWVDCLLKGGRFGYVDGVYARYRKHKHNITSRLDIVSKDLMQFFDILEEEHPEFRRSIIKGRNRSRLALGRRRFESGQFIRGLFLISYPFLREPTVAFGVAKKKLIGIFRN